MSEIEPGSPPPIPSIPQPPIVDKKVKSIYAIASLVIAGVGIPCGFIYLLLTLDSNIALVLFLAMSMIGLVLHGVGALFGIIGISQGSKIMGIIGLIGNGLILFITVLVFFLSFVIYL